MDNMNFDIPDFEMPDFDFGGIDVDIDLSQFNIMGGYDEETRYIKPRLQALKSTQIMYDNAVKLAKELRLGANERADVIVSGAFIFGDFIEAFITENNVKCKKMTISTLSLSQDNIDSLANLLDWGYIDELNLIVSAYWFSHERWTLVPYCYDRLDKENKFQLAVAGIHTKTCQFESLGGKKIVIHGSANLRSSGNIEQFTIEDNAQLYDFYNEIYSNILQRYATINKQIRGKDLWKEMIKKKSNN